MRPIIPGFAQRHPKFEPLYDASNDVTIEVFFADQVFAGTTGGCYWWSCKPGSVPESGRSVYRAYPNAMGAHMNGPPASVS